MEQDMQLLEELFDETNRKIVKQKNKKLQLKIKLNKVVYRMDASAEKNKKLLKIQKQIDKVVSKKRRLQKRMDDLERLEINYKHNDTETVEDTFKFFGFIPTDAYGYVITNNNNIDPTITTTTTDSYMDSPVWTPNWKSQ